MKSFLIAAGMAALLTGAAPAIAAPAAGVSAPQDKHMDRRADRVDQRMDRRDDRVDQRLDSRDDRRDNRRDWADNHNDRRDWNRGHHYGWDRGHHYGWRNHCRNVHRGHHWVRFCSR